MPLIHPVGFFGGARVQAPIMEATPWVLPTMPVLDTASEWTNYANAFVENDAVASRFFNDAAGHFDVAGFRFALPAKVVPYGFEVQLRWSSSAANSPLMRISALNVAANAYATDDAVGATINASTALRTDSFQLSSAPFLLGTPAANFNADQWGLSIYTGSAVDVAATVNIAWIKLRLLYYRPAPGNALILSPERFPQTVVQLADHGKVWSNLANIQARDGAVASAANIEKTATMDTILATNFGHALPARALPVDILFTISGRVYKAESALFAPISMRKANGTTGSAYSGDLAMLFSETILTRNFIKANRWGLGALTAADVNGAGFGVSFALAAGTAITVIDHFIDSVSTRILYATIG